MVVDSLYSFSLFFLPLSSSLLWWVRPPFGSRGTICGSETTDSIWEKNKLVVLLCLLCCVSSQQRPLTPLLSDALPVCLTRVKSCFDNLFLMVVNTPRWLSPLWQKAWNYSFCLSKTVWSGVRIIDKVSVRERKRKVHNLSKKKKKSSWREGFCQKCQNSANFVNPLLIYHRVHPNLCDLFLLRNTKLEMLKNVMALFSI